MTGRTRISFAGFGGIAARAERLLVRVQELTDERDDIARTFAESYETWFDTAERYRAERDEANRRVQEAERALEPGRFIAVLADHALVEIRCDHDAKLDMPVCNCAVWPGGWHSSVQAAKETWAVHVRAVLGGDEQHEPKEDTNG